MTTIWLKPSRQDMQDMVAGRTVSGDAGGTREDSHQTIRRRRPKTKCQTWGPQIAWSRMSRMHGHPLAGMLVGVRSIKRPGASKEPCTAKKGTKIVPPGQLLAILPKLCKLYLYSWWVGYRCGQLNMQKFFLKQFTSKKNPHVQIHV